MQRVFRGYIGRVIAKFRRMERDNKYEQRAPFPHLLDCLRELAHDFFD
jgi:hypothetical protein